MQRFWMWFLALCIGLIVLGTVAIGASVTITLASVLLFVVLFILSGTLQIVQATHTRQSNGFFLHLFSGIFDLLIDVLLITHSTVGALTLTLLLVVFFLVGALFRSFAALSLRFLNWGWSLVGGIVNLCLGVLLWMEWPKFGRWFISLYIGIDMIAHGWGRVMLALAVRPGGSSTLSMSRRGV